MIKTKHVAHVNIAISYSRYVWRGVHNINSLINSEADPYNLLQSLLLIKIFQLLQISERLLPKPICVQSHLAPVHAASVCLSHVALVLRWCVCLLYRCWWLEVMCLSLHVCVSEHPTVWLQIEMLFELGTLWSLRFCK